MINENFVILGALLNLVGTGSYLLDAIRGKVKPNRATWLLWSLAPLIAFSGELSEGVGIRSLMTFMSGFCPLLIFIASFVNKKAFWKLGKLDWICATLSVFGLVLWLITGEGILAITFAIVADGLAATPTIVKSFKFPETENYYAFLGGGASAAIALLTIDDWYYANWGFPVYILTVCTTFILLIRFRLGEKLVNIKVKNNE